MKPENAILLKLFNIVKPYLKVCKSDDCRAVFIHFSRKKREYCCNRCASKDSNYRRRNTRKIGKIVNDIIDNKETDKSRKSQEAAQTE